jgi:hypothetical protein
MSDVIKTDFGYIECLTHGEMASIRGKAKAWDALIARLEARGDAWALEECKRLLEAAETLS